MSKYLLEPLLDGLSTEYTLRSSETPVEKCDRTAPASEYHPAGSSDVHTAGATAEDTTLDGIPQEVIQLIGTYDTDCAGGCG